MYRNNLVKFAAILIKNEFIEEIDRVMIEKNQKSNGLKIVEIA